MTRQIDSKQCPRETYVAVSRGLRKHLGEMTGNQLKLYMELLLSAAFNGPNKGQVATTLPISVYG